MHESTLPQNTKATLEKLNNTDFIKKFYLSGGTALSLQLGHRESEDLDFFSQDGFEPSQLQQDLEKIGELEQVAQDKGTLNCFLMGTQLQFLHYPYKLLEDKIEWKGIYLSSVLDIACTKLLTISSRGSKKDFIDVYFLLQQYELKFLFEKVKEKYSDTNYNLQHILKSLVYFKDARSEPMPRMHKDVSWEEVEKLFIKKIREYNI